MIKNTTRIITVNRRISPISPPAEDMGANHIRNSGETLSNGGEHNTSTKEKVSSPADPKIYTHLEKRSMVNGEEKIIKYDLQLQKQRGHQKI